MGVPAAEKVWQYVTRTYTTAGTGATPGAADHAALLRAIKSALLGFAASPWQVDYSCDGVSAGAPGDGVDRWTSDASLVWGTGAHSWIVLRNVDGVRLLIDLNSSGADRVTAVVSVSAGFAGGTTTARPTAADEVVVRSASTLWHNFTGSGAGVQFDYVLHVMHSTDGRCTRVVGVQPGALSGVVGAAPAGEPALWIEISRVTDPAANWPQPTVFGWLSTEARARYSDLNTSTVFRGYGLGAPGSVNFYLTTPYGATAPIGAGLDGEVMADGAWILAPVGVASVDLRRRGLHGYLPDLYWGSAVRRTGDTYPSGSARSCVQFGHLVTAWSGALPVIGL